MNSPLKRVAVACLVMFGLLLLNVNYIQALKADEYRTDSRNTRNYYNRYEVQRGRITAGGEILAQSVKGNEKFKFVREYPQGPLYAHITGFFSPESASEIERAENSMLDGSSSDLLLRRGLDLFTGESTKGANVDLTIVPKVQKAAFDALSASGQRGAVIAIAPKTGAILAMVSLPTYDPNKLSVPDKQTVNAAYKKLDADKAQPLLNRNLVRTYPPGSTFKVVTAAAFLAADSARDPQTIVDAPTVLQLPNTTATLPNFGGASCGSGQVPLVYALERSCNTPFGKIGMDLGYDAMHEQTQKFGMGEPLSIPMPVVKSDFGPKEDLAAVAQASIGQRSNQMTPIQMAMIAAGIANQGTVMKPYLVDKITDSKGDVVDETKPTDFTQAVSSEVADKLRDMMVSVVANGTANLAQIPGVEVAGKTGTAETGKDQSPHAWFIAFAPAQDPQIALAIMVENGGDVGAQATGGHLAAPIAKAVMEAMLR